jgi:regulator of replication initiation timing
MANQATAQMTVSEPIDRLEEKIKLLVGVVTDLRAAQVKAQAEQARLTEEIGTLRARLKDADSTSGELTALREERDEIRGRVSDMLAQLEGLSV